VIALAPGLVAAHQHPSSGKPTHAFRASLTGSTIYSSLSGFEPDFDPIVRIIIVTHAYARGLPPLNLLLDAYIEQFQSDTQPVLPDLIHPKVALSSTLGGFFSGKAMIVGPSNQILYSGNMLAEALVNPYCMTVTSKVAPPICRSEIQHMLVSMTGQGVAKGGYFNLRSVFVGNQQLQITSGNLYGTALIPPRALLVLNRGGGSMTRCQQPPRAVKTPQQRAQLRTDTRCINQILKDFQVPRPIMRGTAGNGRPSHGYCFGTHCTNPTNSGGGHGTHAGGTTNPSQSSRPAWMAPVGGALIGLALILLAVYFWQLRKERAEARLRAKTPTVSDHGGPSP
jgi:hypothetical protein